MQELLGRLSALDPEASLGLRVIACFDELVAGNVNTRALLATAASLAGCTAGFSRAGSVPTVRVTTRGDLAGPPSAGDVHTTTEASDGLTVWLERNGPSQVNDAIILERLALAVRIRHGLGRRGLDNRRDLGVLVDATVPLDERRDVAGRLGLVDRIAYRVVAAPLFAVWERHPAVPEDVVPTAFGPIHALILPAQQEPVRASPSGTGVATTIDELHRSFRTAMVALRLCTPPSRPAVDADEYGGLVDLFADAAPDAHIPDVDLIDAVMAHSWGQCTLDAVVRAASARQAARLTGVHHSTMQARLDTVVGDLGFDPFEGFGRTRLGVAYLGWRLRHSRVLDLPAPPGHH